MRLFRAFAVLTTLICLFAAVGCSTDPSAKMRCNDLSSDAEHALWKASSEADLDDSQLNVDPLWRAFLKAMAFYRSRENGWNDFPSLKGLPADDETMYVYAQGRMPLSSGKKLAALESTIIVDDAGLLTQLLGALPQGVGLRPQFVLNVSDLSTRNRRIKAWLNLGEVHYDQTGKASIKWYGSYYDISIVAAGAHGQLQFKLIGVSAR